MVFGSAIPDKLKPVEEKGAGYLYMQGSGKEIAQYWESPYLIGGTHLHEMVAKPLIRKGLVVVGCTCFP